MQAYRTYFNRAYNNLKARVARLSETFTGRVAEEVLSLVDSDVALASANTAGWIEHKETSAIAFDRASASQVCQL